MERLTLARALETVDEHEYEKFHGGVTNGQADGCGSLATVNAGRFILVRSG